LLLLAACHLLSLTKVLCKDEFAGWLSKLAPPSDLCNKATSIIPGQVAGLQVEGINLVLNNFKCLLLLAACHLLSLTKV
jgi:hypothetical protein